MHDGDQHNQLQRDAVPASAKPECAMAMVSLGKYIPYCISIQEPETGSCKLSAGLD